MKSAPLYIDFMQWGFIPDPKKTTTDQLVGAIQYYIETRKLQPNTVFISSRMAGPDKLLLMTDPRKLFEGIEIEEVATVDEHCFLIGKI